MTQPVRRYVRRPALIPLALLGLVAAEVTAVVLVARAVGVLLTVGLLVASSLVGGWLLRREGARAWRAFQAAAAEGRPPHREAVDGVLVLLGGLLMLFPGFVSDALGLLCLLPPTRRGLRGLIGRYVARRAGPLRVRARRGPSVDPASGPPTGPPQPPPVIEGELGGPDEAAGAP
jgi:UPF0716 protein FxsA